MIRGRSLLLCAGLAAVLVYLAATMGLMHADSRVGLALVFGIGPVATFGAVRLVDSLEPDLDATTLRLCRVFLTSAFVLLTLTGVVQQTVRLQFRDLIAAAPDVATAGSLRAIYTGVNLVQLGMDVAFDMFYCAAIVILAGALYRHPRFGRVIGVSGIAAGMSLLALNVAAFPYVPAESGLVDLGPVTGVWWLLVIAAQVRRSRSTGSSSLQ